MGFFDNKERDVEKLIAEHIVHVGDCVSGVLDLFKAYFKGKDKYPRISKRIHDSEHEADKVRRQIELKLHEGAFLAMFREDFITLAEAIDKVANKCESVADTLTLEKPEIPEEWQEDFLDLLVKSVETFDPFRNIQDLLSKDLKRILKIASTIEDGEQAVDKAEWKLLEKVFDSELELSQKLQLRDLVRRMAAISDLSEDASDRLEILVVKRRI